ncbi:MAG: phospholipase D-like domain-containing protein [Candidatus Njordarchaeia archaeon]
MLPKIPSIKVLEPLEFFSEFIKDVRNAKEEILIYSPFIGFYGKAELTYSQVKTALKEAIKRRVKIKLIIDKKTTKDSKNELKDLQSIGIEIYVRETHIKAVVIDKDKILYLGSLNPLSYWGKEDIMLRVSGGPIVRKEIRKALEKIKLPRDEERLLLSD